jgi:hypothetical protein
MAMPLQIKDHSYEGWSAYRNEIGFVPDPMILRAGEVFLNGRTGMRGLGQDDDGLWRALNENIGGIVEFMDFVVTRDTIPLISYGETFPDTGTERPLDRLLPGRTRSVEIDYLVYQKVKKGALQGLAELDPAGLINFGQMSAEMAAFRYDWYPELKVHVDPPSDAVRSKLESFREPTAQAASYLLGGLIFDGFAQASRTTHYIQPKRSRFYAALTVAPEQAGSFSHAAEKAIFETTEARLKEAKATQWTGALPPVLPFLLQDGAAPRTVAELLDRAVAFRDSARGRAYRQAASAIRADGIDARITEDMAKEERRRAIELLAPYSNRPDAATSVSLEVKIPGELVAVPGAEAVIKTTFKVGVPTWLRVWWNVEVPFGGIRKTLRRMWMANTSYDNLAAKLGDLWMQS